MKTIDARTWDPNIRLELRRAAAEGTARIVLSDDQEVVVVSKHLWTLLEERAPSLSEAIKNFRKGWE